MTNISQELLLVGFCNLVQKLWTICCFMWKRTRLLLLILPLISSFFFPIFKYQNISSLFSQGLRGLQSWNLVHTWTVGWCIMWAASSEFGTYRLCEQRRFRRACASAQSRQNLRCSLIQAMSQEEPSDRKPDPWLLWMAGHAQLKFVMTECSKTQIRLTGLMYTWIRLLVLIYSFNFLSLKHIKFFCHTFLGGLQS